MKNSLFTSIFLLIVIYCDGQQLQWEKVYQDGFQHEALKVYQFGFDNIALQEKTKPSGKSFEAARNLMISWDGEIKAWESFPSELMVPLYYGDTIGEVFSLGVNRIFCDWCATGIYGEWNISSQNLNAFDRRTDYYQSSDLTYEYQAFYNRLDSINAPNYIYGFPLIKGIFQPNPATLILGGGHVISKISFDLVNNDFMIDNYEPVFSEREIIGLFQHNQSEGLLFTHDTLFLINENLEVQIIQALQTELDSIVPTQLPGIFLGISGNNYYRIDENGNYIETLNISSEITEVKQLELTPNGFRIMAVQENQIRLSSFDNDIETLNFIPDTVKFKPELFVFNNDASEFMLIGNETAVPNKHLVVRKYSINNTGIEPSSLNIALTNIDFQQSTSSACYTIPGSPPIYHYQYIPANVRVKNYSNSEINSFYVNARWDSTGTWPLWTCPSSCFERQFSYRFDTIIPPNESVDLQLWFANPGGNTGISLPVCMWTSSPNFQIDNDPSDDMICAEVPLSLVEKNFKKSELILYPNPVSDKLFFQLNKGQAIDRAEIVDFTGKYVLNSQFQNEYGYSVDVNTFSSGIYFITIHLKNGKLYKEKIMIIH